MHRQLTLTQLLVVFSTLVCIFAINTAKATTIVNTISGCNQVQGAGSNQVSILAAATSQQPPDQQQAHVQFHGCSMTNKDITIAIPVPIGSTTSTANQPQPPYRVLVDLHNFNMSGGSFTIVPTLPADPDTSSFFASAAALPTTSPPLIQRLTVSARDVNMDGLTQAILVDTSRASYILSSTSTTKRVVGASNVVMSIASSAITTIDTSAHHGIFSVIGGKDAAVESVKISVLGNNVQLQAGGRLAASIEAAVLTRCHLLVKYSDDSEQSTTRRLTISAGSNSPKYDLVGALSIVQNSTTLLHDVSITVIGSDPDGNDPSAIGADGSGSPQLPTTDMDFQAPVPPGATTPRIISITANAINCAAAAGVCIFQSGFTSVALTLNIQNRLRLSGVGLKTWSTTDGSGNTIRATSNQNGAAALGVVVVDTSPSLDRLITDKDLRLLILVSCHGQGSTVSATASNTDSKVNGAAVAGGLALRSSNTRSSFHANISGSNFTIAGYVTGGAVISSTAGQCAASLGLSVSSHGDTSGPPDVGLLGVNAPFFTIFAIAASGSQIASSSRGGSASVGISLTGRQQTWCEFHAKTNISIAGYALEDASILAHATYSSAASVGIAVHTNEYGASPMLGVRTLTFNVLGGELSLLSVVVFCKNNSKITATAARNSVTVGGVTLRGFDIRSTINANVRFMMYVHESSTVLAQAKEGCASATGIAVTTPRIGVCSTTVGSDAHLKFVAHVTNSSSLTVISEGFVNHGRGSSIASIVLVGDEAVITVAIGSQLALLAYCKYDSVMYAQTESTVSLPHHSGGNVIAGLLTSAYLEGIQIKRTAHVLVEADAKVTLFGIAAHSSRLVSFTRKGQCSVVVGVGVFGRIDAKLQLGAHASLNIVGAAHDNGTLTATNTGHIAVAAGISMNVEEHAAEGSADIQQSAVLNISGSVTQRSRFLADSGAGSAVIGLTMQDVISDNTYETTLAEGTLTIAKNASISFLGTAQSSSSLIAKASKGSAAALGVVTMIPRKMTTTLASEAFLGIAGKVDGQSIVAAIGRTADSRCTAALGVMSYARTANTVANVGSRITIDGTITQNSQLHASLVSPSNNKAPTVAAALMAWSTLKVLGTASIRVIATGASSIVSNSTKDTTMAVGYSSFVETTTTSSTDVSLLYCHDGSVSADDAKHFYNAVPTGSSSGVSFDSQNPPTAAVCTAARGDVTGMTTHLMDNIQPRLIAQSNDLVQDTLVFAQQRTNITVFVPTPTVSTTRSVSPSLSRSLSNTSSPSSSVSSSPSPSMSSSSSLSKTTSISASRSTSASPSTTPSPTPTLTTSITTSPTRSRSFATITGSSTMTPSPTTTSSVPPTPTASMSRSSSISLTETPPPTRTATPSATYLYIRGQTRTPTWTITPPPTRTYPPTSSASLSVAPTKSLSASVFCSTKRMQVIHATPTEVTKTTLRRVNGVLHLNISLFPLILSPAGNDDDDDGLDAAEIHPRLSNSSEWNLATKQRIKKGFVTTSWGTVSLLATDPGTGSFLLQWKVPSNIDPTTNAIRLYHTKTVRITFSVVRAPRGFFWDRCPLPIVGDDPEGTDFTLKLVGADRPIPLETKNGLESTAVMSTLVSGVVTNPTTGIVTARTSALVAISLCDFSHSEKLDIQDSPFGWKIGIPEGSYYRGALVGNAFILLMSIVLGSFLTWLYWDPREESKTLWKAMGIVHLPGVLIAPISQLLQGSAMVATALWNHGTHVFDPKLAIGTYVILAFITFFVVYKTTLGFLAIVVPRPVPEAGESHFIKMIFYKAFLSKLRWINDPRTEKSVGFKRHWQQLFYDYKEKYPWYLGAEMVISIIIGVLNGIKNEDLCNEIAFAFLGLMAVQTLFACIARPFITYFETFFHITVSVLTCLAALVLVIGEWQDSDETQLVAEYIALATMGIASAKVIFDLVNLFRWLDSRYQGWRRKHRERVLRLSAWKKALKRKKKKSTPTAIVEIDSEEDVSDMSDCDSFSDDDDDPSVALSSPLLGNATTLDAVESPTTRAVAKSRLSHTTEPDAKLENLFKFIEKCRRASRKVSCCCPLKRTPTSQSRQPDDDDVVTASPALEEPQKDRALELCVPEVVKKGDASTEIEPPSIAVTKQSSPPQAKPAEKRAPSKKTTPQPDKQFAMEDGSEDKPTRLASPAEPLPNRKNEANVMVSKRSTLMPPAPSYSPPKHRQSDWAAPVDSSPQVAIQTPNENASPCEMPRRSRSRSTRSRSQSRMEKRELREEKHRHQRQVIQSLSCAYDMLSAKNELLHQEAHELGLRIDDMYKTTPIPSATSPTWSSGPQSPATRFSSGMDLAKSRRDANLKLLVSEACIKSLRAMISAPKGAATQRISVSPPRRQQLPPPQFDDDLIIVDPTHL